MPLSPEWAKLPKRKCDDCGKLFKPVRPSRPGECYFCSANCRKSYHKHGGAYRKLKVEMQKLIAKEFGGIHAELKQLRALWNETESRYVELKGCVDELLQSAVPKSRRAS
jgi:hypothetical protein